MKPRIRYSRLWNSWELSYVRKHDDLYNIRFNTLRQAVDALLRLYEYDMVQR